MATTSLACGRDKPKEVTEAVETVARCSSTEVDWSSFGTDKSLMQCSGGFEYGSKCCDYGAQTSCPHSHKFVDYSETFPLYGYNCRWEQVRVSLFQYTNIYICDYPACDWSRPEIGNILARVNAMRSGCTYSGATISVDPNWTAATAPRGLNIAVDTTSPAVNGNPHWCTVTIRGAMIPHSSNLTAEYALIDKDANGNPTAKRTYDPNVYPPACTNAYDVMCAPKTYATCTGSCTGCNLDGSDRPLVSSPTYCPSLPKQYTAPRTLASFQADASIHSTQWTRADGTQTWRCLSGEELKGTGATTDPAYWQGKWGSMTSLASSLVNVAEGTPPNAPQVGTKRTLAQHRELVFELFGDKLLAGQRTEAEQVYQQLYAAASGGTSTVTPGDSGTACGITPWTNQHECSKVPGGTVAMCGRVQTNMLSADGLTGHVPTALAGLVKNACVNDAGSSLVALSPSTCAEGRSRGGTEYGRVTAELMRYLLATIPGTNDPSGRQTSLRNNLALTESWYNFLKALEPDRALRFRDAEIVAGTIVYSVSAHRTQTLDGLTDIAQRDQLIQQSADDHQELLRVLLPSTGAAPLRNTPALYVLAQSLKSHAARVGEADYLHDFGCRFKNCGPSVPGAADFLQTKTSQMHGVLGKLAEPTQLSAAPKSQLTTAWQQTFNDLVTNHGGVFQSAAIDAEYDSTSLSTYPYSPSIILDATDVNGPLWTIASIIRPSKEKTAHYQSTGRFRPGDANALYTGLTVRKLNEWLPIIENRRVALKTAHQTYDTAWMTAIDNLVAIDTNQEREASARDQLRIKHTQLQQYAERIDGLRVAATVDLERFGDFGKTYDEMVSALQGIDGHYIEHQSSPFLTITPNHARYNHVDANTPPVLNPDEVAVQFNGVTWTMNASSDELVRVQVGASDQWSPTCSIEAHASPTPNWASSGFLAPLLQQFTFRPPLNGYNGAMTGPQGFGVTTSNSSYTAETTTERDFNMWDYAGGAGGLIGFAVGGPAGGAIGGFVGSVMGGLFGGNEQSGSSSGTETRQTAVFNAGLRLNTTPFREFPAGALLLALVDNASGQVFDIQVVQSPSTTIVIPRNENGTSRTMRMYLAVNDAVCPRGANVGALGVQVTRLIPRGGYAAMVQPAMASAHAYVQKQVREKLLPQGMVLPSDLGTIRSQAIAYLDQACGYCDLRNPELASVVQFFYSWIDTELNQAERQVEIQRLQREVTILGMEAESLGREIDGLGRQAELLTLLPAWSINNIDQYQLREQVRDLTDTMEQFLMPFARAKYPEVLDGAPGFIGLRGTPAVFDPITTNLDWSRDWGTLADAMAADYSGIAAKVLQKFTDAKAQFDVDSHGNPVTQTIAIAIPKPSSRWTDNMIILESYAGLYRELPAWDAEQIWSAIQGGQVAEVHVPPDLIYRASTEGIVSGTLTCTDTTPVIQYMALFGADTGLSSNSILNQGPAQRVVTHAAEDVLYATPAGPVSFVGNMPGWLQFSTPIYYGKEASAYSFYSGENCTDPACPRDHPSLFGAGQGLSPFGKLVLSVDPAHLDRTDVYALILFMTVEYRNNTSGLRQGWIERCR